VNSNKDFFEQVHQVARLIPYGRVTTYGAIANYLSIKSAARMVGWAMNAAHKFPDIPAHRVVNRIGVLSGKFHFPELNSMELLLNAEGIQIQDNQIIDFDKYFWDPTIELALDA